MNISVIEKKSLQDSDYLFHEILIRNKIEIEGLQYRPDLK